MGGELAAVREFAPEYADTVMVFDVKVAVSLHETSNVHQILGTI